MAGFGEGLLDEEAEPAPMEMPIEAAGPIDAEFEEASLEEAEPIIGEPDEDVPEAESEEEPDEEKPPVPGDQPPTG